MRNCGGKFALVNNVQNNNGEKKPVCPSTTTHVHIGVERVHQTRLGRFADKQPDALVDEVVVLERGQILVQLLVGRLAIDGAALQVEFPGRRRRGKSKQLILRPRHFR